MNSRIDDTKVKVPITNCFSRENPDKVLNSHGKELTTICKIFQVYAVNNLTKGVVDFDGDFMFHKGNRKSQNNDLLAHKNGVISINSFKILNNINWNPSDHSPICANLCMNAIHIYFSSVVSGDILTTAGEPTTDRAKKIFPGKVNWQTYNELTIANFDSFMHDLKQCIVDPT